MVEAAGQPGAPRRVRLALTRPRAIEGEIYFAARSQPHTHAAKARAYWPRWRLTRGAQTE